MKKFLLSFMSLLMLAIGGVCAQSTSTLTFTSACGGSGTADDGTIWTVTSDGSESFFDNTKGIHYGTSNAAVQYIQLSTSGIPGAISKIVVNASTASKVDATVNVTVGGSDFGTQNVTASAADYTFESSASGEIIVTVTKPSSAKRALYVKSVTVTYYPAESPVAIPVISPNSGSFFTTQEVTFSCATEGAEIYYTIDGSDPKGASATKFERTLLLTQTTIVRAVAKKNDMFSAKATAIFVLNQSNSVNIENSITKYNYWINDNTTDIKTVELVNVPNPYQLVDLLPVREEPIRSSSFHFEIVNNVPKIYAKNDFHICFLDTRGYFVDEWEPFIDYRLEETVNTTEWLTSGKRTTIEKPASNQIYWYKINAEEGDSLQFRLNCAATVQLFSPSGKELLSVSGSEYLNFGCHVRENGTYYLALHDVTARYRNFINIDYNHIDKYAVLRQDVSVVGNGGCSTITFDGNGFNDLYAVDLFNANGDSIHHAYIGHESNGITSVVFDFTDVTLGEYHVKFRFAEGDKVLDNLITVEEAHDIELATTVTYPSTFMRGNTVTYTYTITNTGNMTAYCVPIYIYCETPSAEGITHLELDGLNLSSILEGVNLGNLNPTERENLEAWAKQMGDDHYFLRIKKEGKGVNDSVVVRSNYFTITLPPYGNRVIKLQLTSSQAPNVWFTSLKSLPPFSLVTSINPSEHYNGLQYKYKTKRDVEGIKDWYCCIRERTECMLDRVSYCMERTSLWGTDAAIVVAASGLILGPEVLPVSGVVLEAAQGVGAAGSLLNIVSTNSKVYGNAICGDANTNIMDAFRNSVYRENRQSVTNTLGNAILDYFEDHHIKIPVGTAFSEAKHIQETMIAAQYGVIYGMNAYLWGNEVGNQPDGLAQCMVFKELKSDCIPESPKGGKSIPVISYDPNDIYGYLSEAGSKFMTDEVAKVNYTIEFENDTTFAQAAAHTIAIRDTLDSRYFDLKSFLPTSVKIGEHEVFLDEATDVKTVGGVTSFLKTIDMRPEINAIAQVEGEYSQQTGIAKWTFTSLDPMTMESTDDLMQGVLPVNYDGTSGIGEVMFEVGMKPNKGHGTEIKNRAGIVFDYEEAILTPTWVNTVDAIAPVSHISDVQQVNDSTAMVSIDATDELSGVWRYDVYVQYGEGSAWWKMAENVPADTVAYVKIYEGIDHGFYVVATDSAGNVEVKEPAREWPKSDDDNPTVISNASMTSSTKDPIYNLEGQQVKQPRKGIFIRRGKKEVMR